MAEWQDIASAPKDGSEILLLMPDYGPGGKNEPWVTTGSYLDNSKTQCPWQGWKSSGRGPVKPIKWQPLPSPMTTQSPDATEQARNYLAEDCDELDQRELAEQTARLFHETYERLAPQFSYTTRKASAVPWESVPENNRKLMIATVREVLAALPSNATTNANLVEASEAGGWQDIATAPKDGTRILAIWLYDADGQTGGTETHNVISWELNNWEDWQGEIQPPPSHWQPLPAPPALARTQEETDKLLATLRASNPDEEGKL